MKSSPTKSRLNTYFPAAAASNHRNTNPKPQRGFQTWGMLSIANRSVETVQICSKVFKIPVSNIEQIAALVIDPPTL